MNLNFSCKTQNIRSFNFSSNIPNFFNCKVDALTLEQDDIIMVSNTQIGRNRKILEDAFRFKGYKILTNSTSNAAKGVLIALRIAKDIKIIENDRILIVKTLIEGEEITAAGIYNTNLNSAIFLEKLEEQVSKAEKLLLHCCGTDKINFYHLFLVHNNFSHLLALA